MRRKHEGRWRRKESHEQQVCTGNEFEYKDKMGYAGKRGMGNKFTMERDEDMRKDERGGRGMGNRSAFQER